MMTLTSYGGKEVRPAMRPSDRRKIVAQFIRQRLIQETEQRGRAAQIARATGFSTAHISKIISGRRTVGDDFAYAIAKYWQIDETTLEQDAIANASKAIELPGSNGRAVAPAKKDPMPNLAATLEWCRDQFPPVFFQWYEARARRRGEDWPKMAWLTDMQAKFWEWKQTHSELAMQSPDQASEIRPTARARGKATDKTG